MNKLCLLVLILPATAFGQLRDDEDDDGPPPIPQAPPQGQYQYPPQGNSPQNQYQYPPGKYPPEGYRSPPNQYPVNPYSAAQNPPPQYPQAQYRQPTGQPPQGRYQYPRGQPQGGYPQGYQYSPGQYPKEQYPSSPQPYRSNPYPPNPVAPQNQYPPRTPPARDAPLGQPALASATPAKLVLTTANEAARADALGCADAIENYHLDTARTKCAEALAKDPGLALAHLWMAEAAATPAIADSELVRASEAVVRASSCERALVEGYRAWREARVQDARRAYDALVGQCGGDRRAFIGRGQFRQVALADLAGAVEDYRQAIALDDKVGASENFLGFALAAEGKHDEAEVALKRYATLSPGEPNAHDSLATLALRSGDAVGAIAEAHAALTIDPRFVVAHGTLGDALLMTGKAREARREYALLEASDDATVRHDGAMRAARSMLWEDHTLDAERALVREAAGAQKAGRLDQAADAFLEAVRIQVERGALGEAGRGIKEATEALRHPAGETAPTPSMDVGERRRLVAQLTEVRAMALASIGERELAEARADGLAAELKLDADPRAEDRVRGLRGWIAWRLGDDPAALAALTGAATAPSLRFTLALSLARSGDGAHARSIMEELAKRGGNDLETALSRPRAAAWLKLPPPSTASAAR